eukprot:TRINITY_DN12654_c0_g1_i2.p1 TRINITY_DN12654_c0_g1~~TRINITY_DN12654_c0_g1_i2.p1  ORF type:complete len:576 (+),score=110.66 TRINITY_DN12654_c0_g1_i2:36-1763(+)
MKRPSPGSTQNAKRARAEDVSPYVRQVVDALLGCGKLLVEGSKIRYRNKVTYSLTRGVVVPSDLATDACNTMCAQLCQWMQQNTPGEQLGYWHEVSIKHSRKGTYMIKFLIVCPKCDLDTFIATQVQRLVGAFSESNIECVTLQHSESKTKPKKEDGYTGIVGEGLTEVTPWGDEYLISPDTFAEVNHEIEDSMWHFIHSLLQGDGACDLVLMGRDSNAVFVSMLRRMKERFKHVTCLPHCPRVHDDLVKNYERKVKDDLGSDQSVVITRVTSKWDYAKELKSLGTARDNVVLVNSGRGGLAKETAQALRDNATIRQVIYVSCNEKTSYQDADVLLTGPGAFYVSDYRSYDFMPGTEYRLQIFDFRRDTQCVILPVGPPGSGKSTLAQLLSERGLATAIERDVVYANEREKGKSLKAAKHDTHEVLLASLEQARGHVVYDSTNGDPGGRALMCATAFGEAPFKGTKTALLVSYEGRPCKDWLLNNCLSRVAHVSFPSDPEEARVKIDNVLLGMHEPTYQDDFPSIPRLIVQVHPQHTTPSSIADYVSVLLLLSPSLAQTLAPVLLADGIRVVVPE